ncbi:Rne/Rng family ribonuclease [Micropruina sonneratiae]|uniref:Rne/Rng family ribonuclease n=1 Tax=Micropruina sonneratiae TaxID=2986940 RepID=UPI002226262A|nr:Rne/Rng family ribonuclease [Micropruina sp. KQZ13P-5]MCW3158338.1 Rne/Rng family ribonuclease [Micropruina sp. KQZ13P-5]
MLDTDTPAPGSGDSAVDETAQPPTPPRRRRAASRPAGPPAPAPEPAEVAPEVTEPIEDEAAAESEAVETQPGPVPDEPATAQPDESDAVAPVEDEAAAVEHEQAPDEPAEDEQTEAEPAATVRDEPEPAEAEDQQQGNDEAAAEPVAPEPPAKPARRRRATRAAAAPEPVSSPATEAVEEDAPASDQPAAEQPGDQQPDADGIVEVTAGAAETEQQRPLSLDELPSLDELAPQQPTEARGRRRRRKSEPESVREAEADAASAPADDAASDPVAASLENLSRSRRGKRAKVDEDAAAEALDQLAAAIGGQGEAAGQDADEAESLDEASAHPTTDGDDDDQAVDTDDSDDNDDNDDPEGPRRRRRRRGGRRRRRGGSADDAETGDADDTTDGEASDGDNDGEAEPAAEAEGGSSSSRRRRRRRRRGEDTTGAEDDPSDVVVRVREPRRSKAGDEVTGIEGSTRMEAKRQRRREGRAAGRRRSPILSEAEFLARRESVDRAMLIRQADDYTQLAVLEDGILVEHYVDRASATSMIGNVYLGKVQNVLPSMEAAFIDIGRGRNAVLYAGEVDWDTFGVTGGDRKMEKVFKSGQSVLVQVTKDPIGAKGARLTGHVSVPGRYVVYSPSGQLSGISRKLPEQERNRLKGILDGLVGDHASVIVRTAAEGASEDELVRDVNRLKAQWEIIEKKVKAGKSPEQLYTEPELTLRIVRDLFTEDFGRLIVDGNGKGEDAWDSVEAYVGHVAPHLKERLVHWDRGESGDLFEAHRINEQIAKALERKVFLPSGGSLIIDRTEAMTVIDVNTGKFTGTQGNLEATVTSNNLEAAEEIVRQLRLRDIGGIIVIDFIDMVLPANRELLLRRLVECLGRDRTRHQVAEVTSLGLVQMTRKRIGTGLAEAFTVTCETCHGRGYHRHDTPVDSQAPADGGEREHGRRRR